MKGISLGMPMTTTNNVYVTVTNYITDGIHNTTE